jgi:hypothetical protein
MHLWKNHMRYRRFFIGSKYIQIIQLCSQINKRTTIYRVQMSECSRYIICRACVVFFLPLFLFLPSSSVMLHRVKLGCKRGDCVMCDWGREIERILGRLGAFIIRRSPWTHTAASGLRPSLFRPRRASAMLPRTCSQPYLYLQIT